MQSELEQYESEMLEVDEELGILSRRGDGQTDEAVWLYDRKNTLLGRIAEIRSEK